MDEMNTEAVGYAESGVRLSKSQSVLDYSEVGSDDARVLFRNDEPLDEWRRSVLFRTQDWIDMGSPKQVTITVEPGDMLNTKEQG